MQKRQRDLLVPLSIKQSENYNVKFREKKGESSVFLKHKTALQIQVIEPQGNTVLILPTLLHPARYRKSFPR